MRVYRSIISELGNSRSEEKCSAIGLRFAQQDASILEQLDICGRGSICHMRYTV